ncbi:MAG: peroxiredoxin-like family protein [Cypionkella sp.]
MEKPSLLAPRLAYCRNLPGTWCASYDALVERLRASGAMDGAPGLGDVLPDFALPDVDGKLRQLSDLLADGPAVLSFNRGSWCPYCEQEIGAWSEHRAAMIAAGARLIIVTPETGGRMAALAEIAGEGAVVLCDLNMGVALQNGLAFPVGPTIAEEYRLRGFDLSDVNGTASGFLPVPATFVLDAARKVHFAFVDPDFSQRAEPEAVLAILSTLPKPV